MIWLVLGSVATFALGYWVAGEYAAIKPALTAAKGFSQFFQRPRNPAGPSSAGDSQGKAVQSQ